MEFISHKTTTKERGESGISAAAPARKIQGWSQDQDAPSIRFREDARKC
jgi:hypothetical protein